jgi:antitoxin component YwqK of YwqJK toxin-antitoxin module
MIKYDDLLLLKLSGIAEWKNNKEMRIPIEMTKYRNNDSLTCEFIDLDNRRYIIRGRYSDRLGTLFEMEYKDNNKDGKQTERYSSGEIQSQSQYKNGQEQGRFIAWHKNGNKAIEVNHDENGQWHGKYTEYDEYGNILIEQEYINGEFIKTMINNK